MRKLIYIALFVIFITTIRVVLPLPAEAATGLTIQPVKVSHTIKPGQSVTGTIVISNASDIDVLVSTKAEDFVPLAGSSNIQFVGRAPGLTTVSDWITIHTPESFSFTTNERKEVQYTITAPLDAEPGSHFGVIFFKANDLVATNEQLKVGTQVGMLVFVTVPGDFVQEGKILDFSGKKFSEKPPVDFNVRFENTGTVHYEPKGVIDITNIFGKKISSVPVEGQIVLPTGVKDINVSWAPTTFVFGKYKATLTINDSEGKSSGDTRSFSFYIIPTWYIVEIIIAIIIIFFILRFVRRKIRISIVK